MYVPRYPTKSNAHRYVGQRLGTKKAESPLVSGQKLFIGAREVELDSPIAQSELPTLTGTDLSQNEAFDPDAIPFATPRDKDDEQETNNPSEITAALQPSKSFVPPTSFYGNPPEKKEKRKPLWVSCAFS
jgi:DNA repair and recombination protein RAD54B